MYIVAIKTGRYTHEKRTRDTLEVKSGVGASSSSTDDKDQSPANSELMTRNEAVVEPLDYSLSKKAYTDAPVVVCPDKLKLEDACRQSLTIVSEAFRSSFRDTAYLYENPEKVEAMLKTLLEERNLEDVTEVVAHTGATATPEQCDHYRRFEAQVI